MKPATVITHGDSSSYTIKETSRRIGSVHFLSTEVSSIADKLVTRAGMVGALFCE
jgi:hypothetical protein